MDSISVLFNLDELWLLHAQIRHEMPNQEQWKIAPVSKSLNTAIAYAILLCVDTDTREAYIELSEKDLYVIDYCISFQAKDVNGKSIGKDILLKSFRARQQLAYITRFASEPSESINSEEVIKLLKVREEQGD